MLANPHQGSEDSFVPNLARAVACLVMLLVVGPVLAQGKAQKRGKFIEPVPVAAPQPAPVIDPEPAPTPVPVEPLPLVVPVKPNVAVDRKPRLAVLSIQPQGVPQEQAAAMTDSVVAALSSRAVFDIISTRDIETALGAERQRQLLGVCDSNPDSCGVSLGDSLSAPFVLSGQLSRVGTAFQLTLQTVDTAKGRAIARSNRLASSLEELQKIVPYAAAEATGSPLPPPPSRVVPITLLAIGGATLLSGAVYGVITLTQQAQFNGELCPVGIQNDGRCSGTALRELSFYLAQNDALTRQKWVSAGLVAAGAVIATLGLVLMPPPDSQSRASVLMVPTFDGLAVVGEFW
jgi:TolB-like protein